VKWIVVVLSTLALATPSLAHHGVVHGWKPPDNFCHTAVGPAYYQNCIRAQRVIYKVFPDNTQRGAMLVARCETGRTYDRWATNRSSRTAGLFQIHPGNIGRFVYWRNRHIIISPDLYNPWVNAEAALYLSKGGKDWHEWDPVCHP